ncbi:MAG: hypothetical protein SFV51_11650 [Bryobacteraceae bacterium]|nr:hypothetical protein [Bryobacteraceae bacterium]
MALRFLAAFVLLAGAVWAANVKLYLKDGGWHVVREYKVEDGRVRFYSTERADWEEIPVELVDLKRTELEIRDRGEADRAEAALIDAEEKAEREAAAELARVPVDVGVYWVSGKQLKPLSLAEATIVTNKRRSILKKLSPIPMVSGKATLELEGLTSAFVVDNDTPEFYFRLSEPQRFGIVRLELSKQGRIVEKLTIVPVSNETIEEQQPVEIFRQQVGEQLYKVWPQSPLEPGEYALVEYTDGKMNIQVYDFAYKTKGGATPAAEPPQKTNTSKTKVKPKKK